MFPLLIKIFHMCMLRSSMQKFRHFQPLGLVHKAKIGYQTKKVDFFKVGDTLTIV